MNQNGTKEIKFAVKRKSKELQPLQSFIHLYRGSATLDVFLYNVE